MVAFAGGGDVRSYSESIVSGQQVLCSSFGKETVIRGTILTFKNSYFPFATSGNFFFPLAEILIP